MSVSEKMTAIADATRALDGSTAKLTLDGIASALGVEKSNVTAALAAIAEKGVTVPDGSTSDALAELIAAIEAGGGNIATGTITFAEDSYSWVGLDNLDYCPNFAALVRTEIPSVNRHIETVVHFNDLPLCCTSGWLQTTPSHRTYMETVALQIGNYGEGAFYYYENSGTGFNFGYRTATGFYFSGTYHWIALG